MSVTGGDVAMLVAALVAIAVVVALGRAAPSALRFRSSAALAAVVALSAVLAALGPGDPSGIEVLDALYRGAFGALLAVFASRARRGAWLAAAGIAAMGAHPEGWGIASFALLGVATGAAFGRRWGRPAAALWGLALAQALLRMTWPEPIGLTALLAAAAAAILGVSWYRQARRHERRIARWGMAGVATATGALVVLAALSGLASRGGLTNAVDTVQEGLAAARDGDLATAAERFDRAASALTTSHGDLTAWWARPTRALPVVGRYLADAEDLTLAGADAAQRAGRVAQRSSAQLRLVDGGIDLAALQELRGELADSVLALGRAERRVRRPEAAGWTPGPLQDRYDELAADLRDGIDDAEVLLQAVDLAPGFLGGDGPRRWLLTVFSPAEQRNSGGVLGNYGELISEGGRIRLDHFARIGELTTRQYQREVTLTPELAEPFARYGEASITTYIQNAMHTPDFAASAAATEHLYPQLDGNPVTGTIAVDPTGLAALLEVTGPVSVAGWPEPISADNAESILYFEQYRLYEDDARPDAEGDLERDDFLGAVAQAVITRLTSGDLGSPADLVQALAPAVDAGHLMVHSADPAEQAFLEQVDAAGTVHAPAGGDFLRVGTQNTTQTKIEWFLHRSVRYEPTFDPATGEVTARVEVELRNDAPADGLPAYIIGGANEEGFPAAGVNRLGFTVWTPLDVTSARVGGEEIIVSRDREVGYNAFGGYVEVPPGGTTTVVLELTGTISAGDTYRLRVGTQPQIHPDELTIHVRAAEGWEPEDQGPTGDGTVQIAETQQAELEVNVAWRRRDAER